MNDQQKRTYVRHSIDDALSTVQADPWLAERIMRQEGERATGKRRLSLGLVVLVALLLLATVAIGVVKGFGILDYLPQQADNERYVENIVTLDQQWEGEFFSATVHEAVFDGMKMTFTMSIAPKDGADPVYVIPRIRAAADGQPVDTWVMGGRGGFMEDGFWMPAIMPEFDYDDSGWAVDVSLGNDALRDAPKAENIEWEITFDVLHTDWPIHFTQEDEPGMGEPEWTEKQWDTYEQQFRDAYANKQVLLNRAGMFSFWLPEEIERQEDESYADYCQRVLTTEAFTLVECATFRFTAAGQPVKTAKEPVRFTQGGFDVEMTALNVSASQIGITLRITRSNGDARPIRLEEWEHDFVLMAENAKTSFLASSLGSMEDGSLQYRAEVMLEGATDKLLLLPVGLPSDMVTVETADGPVVTALHRALMQKLIPMTAEQEALAIEIPLE